MKYSSKNNLVSIIIEEIKSTLMIGLLMDFNLGSRLNLPISCQYIDNPEMLGFDADRKIRLISNFDIVGSSDVESMEEGHMIGALVHDESIVNFCAFWPQPWHADLGLVNIRTLNINYALYLTLDNKITQINILKEYGSPHLQANLSIREQLLRTIFQFVNPSLYFKYSKLYGTFVITKHNSHGGTGVFKIVKHSDYINALPHIDQPIVRIEKYLNSYSLTQMGIIFKDKVIVYPLLLQLIRDQKGHLVYAGATIIPNNLLPDEDIEKASSLTREIGIALSKIGYLGAFGCDYIYMINEKTLAFMELNPRFVGETPFYSMLAAHSIKYSVDLMDRIVLDPHFLHVCAHITKHFPFESNDITNDSNEVRVCTPSEAPFTSMLPLSLVPGSMLIPSAIQPFHNRRVCAFIGEPILESSNVPIRFLPEIEELWTTLHQP